MKTLQELQAIRDKMKEQTMNRGSASDKDIRIVVGMATCGIAAGARPVLTTLNDEIAKRKLANVSVSQTGCIGLCKLEPIVEVFSGKDKVTYVNVNAEMAQKIVASHIVNGTIVDEYIFKSGK